MSTSLISSRVTIPLWPRASALGVSRFATVVALSVVSLAQVQTPYVEGGDTSRWKTFASRAGWSIRYPPDLHVSSCRQCEDPTAPEVFVDFSGSSGQVWVMIEPLADRRAGQSIQQWLDEVQHITVLSPALSKQWVFIDGAPTLRVMNRPSDSGGTENNYVAHGLKTFAIRFPHIQDARMHSLCEQMLSTLRFSSS